MAGRPRGMEEHEFRLVSVDLKANTLKPVSNKRSKTGKLSNNPRERFARSENAPVIHIKRNVGVARAAEAKLKNGGSKESGEDRGERQPLGGTT